MTKQQAAPEVVDMQGYDTNWNESSLVPFTPDFAIAAGAHMDKFGVTAGEVKSTTLVLDPRAFRSFSDGPKTSDILMGDSAGSANADGTFSLLMSAIRDGIGSRTGNRELDEKLSVPQKSELSIVRVLSYAADYIQDRRAAAKREERGAWRAYAREHLSFEQRYPRTVGGATTGSIMIAVAAAMPWFIVPAALWVNRMGKGFDELALQRIMMREEWRQSVWTPRRNGLREQNAQARVNEHAAQLVGGTATRQMVATVRQF